ncbi:VOC family protein [Bdellovibrio bacteriovorus]|uniref:VOC family protein n=1 Tax=Bdellovibrio bacteriovorus TaxID=959 RepID=UPI0035A71694
MNTIEETFMNRIYPCLWFDTQAEEAVKFYTSLFKNSKTERVAHYNKAGAVASGQKEGSVMTVEFHLEGQPFMALNGGPAFKHTPAVSFFVSCNSEKEIDELWSQLSKGGSTMFELKEYPWAKKYGWCQDKFGVPWQLMLWEGKQGQKIAPSLLFTGKMYGKGEEAIHYYISQFKNSKIESLQKDPQSNSVMHSMFSLDGQEFALMEGQDKKDNEITAAMSFVVNCKTQEEIDQYSEKLSKDGVVLPCGWVQDKYGVSWQIVPVELAEMMASKDVAKAEKVMKAMLGMKKLDLAKLKEAFH